MLDFFEKIKLKWDIYKLQKLILKLEKPSSINFTPLRYKYSSGSRELFNNNKISNKKKSNLIHICHCESCQIHSIYKIPHTHRVIILIY